MHFSSPSSRAGGADIFKGKRLGGLCLRKKLREMDRDKQSSKHAFGAWSDPTKEAVVDDWMASHRSVTAAACAPPRHDQRS
jgi:hypothetical protein